MVLFRMRAFIYAKCVTFCRFLLRARYKYRLMTAQTLKNTLRTHRKHLANEMYRVELLIIPPIVRNGATALPRSVYCISNSAPIIRAQLSIRRSRAGSVPHHVSIDSGGLARLSSGGIIRKRDDAAGDDGDVGRVRRAHGYLPRCLSSAGAFHQSHTNNSCPLRRLSVLIIYMLEPGCSVVLSSSIVLALRVPCFASFYGQNCSRLHTTSMISLADGH